jgi:large subunit ribosomal protein L14e
VDGPVNLTGVKRQVINIKWVSLTDFVVKISLNARQATLTKAWTAAGIQEKWAASAWAKKAAAKKAKAALNDFGRFQAKVKQQALAKKVKAAVAKA